MLVIREAIFSMIASEDILIVIMILLHSQQSERDKTVAGNEYGYMRTMQGWNSRELC